MTPPAQLAHVAATPEQVRADQYKQAVAGAFVDWSAERQRGPHDLGISALGGCTRRAAYMIARTDPSDQVPPREGRQANLGTAEHEHLLPRVAARLGGGALTEVDVDLRAAGLIIPGHIDLLGADVVDLKTVGEHRLQAVRRRGESFVDHCIQEAGYGLGRLQAGAPPEHLVTIYLDRASGDDEILVERFTNDHVLMVVDRVQDLVDHADDPDRAPRINIAGEPLRGPVRSFACSECAFLRRCWGPLAVADKPVDRTPTDAPEIEAALAEYERGRDLEREGREAKKRAAELLAGVKVGKYGPYELGRDRASEIDDESAAVALLRRLGYEVPRTRRQGSLRVKRSKPDPPAAPKRRSRETPPTTPPPT